MVDFRRWVSYIYRYENGIKGQNAGFARITKRAEQVRFDVCLSEASKERKIAFFGVYPTKDGPDAILLHEGVGWETGEEIKFDFDCRDFYTLNTTWEELQGIVIVAGGKRGDCYASCFVQDVMAKSAIQAVFHRADRLSQPAFSKIETETDSEARDDSETEADFGMERAGTREEMIGEETTDKKEADEEEKGVETPDEETMGGKGADEKEKGVKMPDEETIGGKETDEDKKDLGTSDEGMTKEEKSGKEKTGMEGHDEKKIDEEETVSEPEEKDEMPQFIERAKRPFVCLKKRYPFEDAEFECSVQLEPQDIGMLPRCMWKFAGNSFLLHGFYTYHHLLLTRKREKEGYSEYLMIPGQFGQREERMAQMYGFSQFKCQKRKMLEEGDFGYWFLKVPSECPYEKKPEGGKNQGVW